MAAHVPDRDTAGLVREWFDRLAALQAFVQTVSSTARDDLAAFSRQTLDALIGSSPLRQEALVRFCHTHDLGHCRLQVFDNLKKTFRDFVDELGLPVHEVLVYRCFDLARYAFVPPYEGRMAARFRTQRVADLCGDRDNARALSAGLLADVPPEFCAGKPDLVGHAVRQDWTVDDLCREIVR